MEQKGGEGVDSGHSGGGNLLLSQPTDLAFDPGRQSGTINNPSMSLAAHGHAGYLTHANNRQLHLDSHMPGAYGGEDGGANGADDEEEEDDDDEDEEDQTREAEEVAAATLSGMSANHLGPGAVRFHGGGGAMGAAGAWGSFGMPMSCMNAAAYPQNSLDSGIHMTGSHTPYGMAQQEVQNPFGYHMSTPSQYQDQKFPPQAMYPRASFGTAHAGGYLMRGMQTPNMAHFPHADPRGSRLPNSAFTGANSQPPATIKTPHRFGSDPDFDEQHYRPTSAQEPQDHKDLNLLGVPFSNEARAPAYMRQTPGMTQHPGAHEESFASRAPGLSSRPSLQSPTSSTYTHNHFGGLPATMMNGNSQFQFRSHPGHAHPPIVGHGHPSFLAFNGMQAQLNNNSTAHATNHVPGNLRQSHDDESNTHESQAPPKSTRSKRRKSDYEAGAEEDYAPPGRTVKRTKKGKYDDISSGEDVPQAPKSGKAKGKRAQSNAAARTSIASPSVHALSSSNAATPRPSPSPGRPKKRVSPPQAGTRAGLTDEERRRNHINSEKKRRDSIKDCYDELEAIVPALRNGNSGHSKAESLREILEFVQDMGAGNQRMKALLDGMPDLVKGEYDEGDSCGDEDDDAEGEDSGEGFVLGVSGSGSGFGGGAGSSSGNGNGYGNGYGNVTGNDYDVDAKPNLRY